MTFTLDAATSSVDAMAEGPPPASAPSRGEDAARHARRFGVAAPRPAPANWRGCGYRRAWTTANGGRAA